MKKIYLVRKDPARPAGKDNWIVMGPARFRQFAQTPEGRARLASFGRLDGCSPEDTVLFAECGKEIALR